MFIYYYCLNKIFPYESDDGSMSARVRSPGHVGKLPGDAVVADADLLRRLFLVGAVRFLVWRVHLVVLFCPRELDAVQLKREPLKVALASHRADLELDRGLVPAQLTGLRQ